MSLEVQQAQVSTATVEIKTLTVSGKQVTLAVFRQLQEEPLLDMKGLFRGNPWGRVNYHPPDCTGKSTQFSTHIHGVWQKGEELRRATVQSAWLEASNALKFYRSKGLSREDELGARDLLEARFHERWQELHALPQLFIAV